MLTDHHLTESGRRRALDLSLVLVDDNPMTVKLACHIFTEDGWDAHGFTSAWAALEALKVFEPDLIIADYRMPEMSGPEFLLAASRIHELTPKLIMTAYEDDDRVKVALRKAAVPSVSKADGLTELLNRARLLVAVRSSIKLKAVAAAGMAS